MSVVVYFVIDSVQETSGYNLTYCICFWRQSL